VASSSLKENAMENLVNSVFVISTCYDLIDIRAEVSQLITEMGLVPRLSELGESAFDVSFNPDENSIEMCLRNVKQSDLFVCILSRRYGPTIGSDVIDRFYDGIELFSEEEALSATHLEYRLAVKLRKPIYFFVRDRTLNELDVSIRRWIGEKDLGVFKIIKEHRTLSVGRNNWYTQFKDSVELRSYLSQWLERKSEKGKLHKMMLAGVIPPVHLSVIQFNRGIAKLRLLNMSRDVFVLNVVFRDSSGCEYDAREDIYALGYNASGPSDAEIPMRGSVDGRAHGQVSIAYETSTGYQMRDTFSFFAGPPRHRLTLKEKILLGRSKMISD
jgi:hypothetical protein